MLFTFGLTVFAWIFFRANNISHAFSYISGIFSSSLFTIPSFITGGKSELIIVWITIILVCIFMIVEWFGREQKYAIANLGLKWNRLYRYAMYFAIICAIFIFNGKEQQFIYFQF